MTRNILPIIPYGVWVEASFSLGQDLIGWRQSRTTGRTLCENIVLRQFPWAYNKILVGDDPALDRMNTERDLELKREAEEWKLHGIAKVHNFFEMWQASQNLHATQKETCTQNKPMTAVWYIVDTEEIAKTSWSNFQHDGAAAFELSESSPVPPALSANDLHAGHTQLFNVCRIKRTNRHPADCDQDSTPETILDAENWLDWIGDLDTPNDSDDDCETENGSDIELNTSIQDPETPEQWDVSATPKVPGLIWPTQANKNGWQGLMTVNTMETRRNKWNETKYDWLRQWIFPRFFMLHDYQFHLVKFYVRILSSLMRILVNKPQYSRQNETFCKTYKFQ